MRMRAQAGFQLMLSILLGWLALACRAPAPVPPQPGWVSRPGEFSRDLAWQHLEALVRIGPRVTDTEGAKRAREYIVDELSKLDIEVETQSSVLPLSPEGEQEIHIKNLVGVIPGDSESVVILGAPYDSRFFEDFRFVGANDAASGAAVLLEIARVLAERPLPYTTWLAFFDGEALRSTGESDGPNVALLGSTAFAIILRQHRLIPHIRLVVVLNRVGDADLRIARDLRSDRVYREEFFDAAARLGRAEAFPRDQIFESPVAAHRSFQRLGLRRAVLLTDTSFGGDEPPGPYANSEDDNLEHCSPESLETVGAVVLEALETITKRLVKIDMFAGSPVIEPVEVPTGPPEPEGEESSPEEGEATSAEETAGDDAEASEGGEPSPEEGDGTPSQETAEGDAEVPGEALGQGEAAPEGAAP
jgi:glutaminyl-peptide cyclotransferase